MDRPDLDIRTTTMIRRLVYPVQFLPNPAEYAGSMAEEVRNGQSQTFSVQDYIDAVQVALASPAQLSEIANPRQSEDAVRAYLSALLALLRPHTAH